MIRSEIDKHARVTTFRWFGFSTTWCSGTPLWYGFPERCRKRYRRKAYQAEGHVPSPGNKILLNRKWRFSRRKKRSGYSSRTNQKKKIYIYIQPFAIFVLISIRCAVGLKFIVSGTGSDDLNKNTTTFEFVLCFWLFSLSGVAGS